MSEVRCPVCGGASCYQSSEGWYCSGEGREESGKRAIEELARVTETHVTGPDGFLYHWIPGAGWCGGHPGENNE